MLILSVARSCGLVCKRPANQVTLGGRRSVDLRMKVVWEFGTSKYGTSLLWVSVHGIWLHLVNRFGLDGFMEYILKVVDRR